MSKAILVIDMPDSCSKCPLFGGFYSDMCCKGLNNRGINYPYPENFRQDWCPLKPVPEKKLAYITSSDHLIGFGEGYNACIDDIIGK